MPLLRSKPFLKRKLQYAIESATGNRVLVNAFATHGHRDCRDIARTGQDVRTIVDVGANVGQSAVRFRSAFPHARILCFEPVARTFERLRRNLAGTNVESYQLAVGASSGRATIYLTHLSTTNSLIEPENHVGTEEVEVVTLDAFLPAHGVDSVDLLKVDAEGHDLEVLKGAERLLSGGHVRFIEVEVGFGTGDDKHVTLEVFRDALATHGFAIFGFYDQTLEWSGERRLRYANALFARR